MCRFSCTSVSGSGFGFECWAGEQGKHADIMPLLLLLSLSRFLLRCKSGSISFLISILEEGGGLTSGSSHVLFAWLLYSEKVTDLSLLEYKGLL